MKTTYVLLAKKTGTLEELMQGMIDDAPGVLATDQITLEDIVESMKEMAFMIETIAHLQGREATMLPTAEKARGMIAALTGEAA